MGFLQPRLPDIDLAEWSQGSRSQKIRPMAQHWAEVGFGTPVLLHLFYVAKILLYVLVGWLIVLTTKGIDGFTDAAAWYAEPIVFEKVVLYTMLFEVIGLGCGFGPLNNRFFPPMGSILYWMRFGTIRLPPWPDRVPWTRGTKRKPVDVALYALLVMMLLSALFTDGAGPIPELGTTVGLLPAWQIVLILLLLGVLGLRDKVIFLAARGEVYATLTVTFLFGRLNGIDMAATIMVCFHLGILTAIPMGVPLEWNVFMIFGVLSLFVGHACLGLADVKNPVPLAILIAVVAGIVIAGNVFPRKISFLAAMRYYAGNWDTTLWCIKPSAEDKINRGIVAIASMPAAQLERFYGKDRAQIPMYLGYAFRAMNSHGRALFTLAHRAMAGHDEDDYVITDGERVCSTAVGWNFGDGHLHNEQLIAAMQQRCGFQPGEVRVVLLDAQPIHRQTQEYRLVDAATGEFERGYVRVADMVNRQPWDDDVPVHVLPG